MNLEEKMWDVGHSEKKVTIIDVYGNVYKGEAFSFHQGADEEDGIPTVCVRTKDRGSWCLGENEIKSIQEE